MASIPSSKTISRKEYFKQSVFGWVLLLGLSLFLIYFYVLPRYQEWDKFSKNIKKNEKEIKTLTTLNQSLSKEASDVQQEFEVLRAEHMPIDIQVFPEKIDPFMVARIFELYALQLNNIPPMGGVPSVFELKGVDIGRTGKAKNLPYATTSFNLSFSADYQSLRDIISFLHTGNLSIRIDSKKVLQGLLAADYTFLLEHKLPVAHVTSVRANPIFTNKKMNNSVSAAPDSGILDVSLSGVFFSQTPR